MIELAPTHATPEFPGVNAMRVLLKGSIMDMGLSAGEAAQALRDDFQAETLGTEMADAFLKSVQKDFRWFNPDSYTEHHRYLIYAEALLELLSIEVGAAVSRKPGQSTSCSLKR